MDSMIIQKYNLDIMREHNQNLYYNLIRIMGPISKAALARLTGMSPTSSGRIVNQLLSDGYVREAGETEGSVGRKAILLEIVTDGILSIGVEVEAHHISAGMVDVEGKILSQCFFENDPSFTTARMLEIIKQSIDTILSNAKDANLERIKGIGISIPGIVDWKNGIVHYSPQLGWENVPLKALLQNSYQMDVAVENNVKATAEAESLFGIAKAMSNFLVLQIGSGIGAALVANGEVLRGNTNMAGEIGHLLLDIGGTQCDCGRRGCLQSSLCILGIEHITHMPFEQVVAKAESGDQECMLLLDTTATKLAQWVANLTNLYDPSLVIVCGEMVDQWDKLLQYIKERHERFMWQPGKARLNIQKSGFSQYDLPIVSAAAVILSKFIVANIIIREKVGMTK